MTRSMLVANADTPIGAAVARAAIEAGYAIADAQGDRGIDALFVAPCPADERDGVIGVVSPGAFAALVDSDLGATVRLLRAVLPRLLASRGSIILSTHDSGTGPADTIARSVSAEAAATLAKSITYQYGPQGLRANAVAIPADGDGAMPAEVARLVLFLASPDASYMTGTVLTAGRPERRP